MKRKAKKVTFASYNYGFKGTPKVKILVSNLGNDAGILGAAALFF